MFFPTFFSAVLFIACLSHAISNKRGRQFLLISGKTLFLLCVGLLGFLSMIAEGALPESLISKNSPGMVGKIEFCFFVFQFLLSIASVIVFLIVPCKPASANPAAAKPAAAKPAAKKKAKKKGI